MKNLLLAIFLIPAFPARVLAGSGGADSLEFLNISVGARPVAMGEAFTAVADDANAVHWNPAGLAQLRRKEISFMYARWFEEIDYGGISYAHPLRRGVAGAYVSYLSYGEIQGYDADGIPSSGKLEPRDLSLGLAYSQPLFVREDSRLYAGTALKFIREDLVAETANAWAMDLGLLYKTPLPPLNLGAVFKNAGIGPKYVKVRESLPASFKLGASAGFLSDTLIVALDHTMSKDYVPYTNAGAEYLVSDLLALRAGYQFGGDPGDGLRLGFGLGNKNLVFDYAFVSYGDLRETQRFGISLRFGAEHERTEIERALEQQYRKALADYQRGRVLDAYRGLKELLTLAPGYKDAQDYLARTRVSVDQAELAKEIRRHTDRGILYFDQGEVVKAQSEFETVLEFDPENQEAREYLARIKKRFEEVVSSIFNRGLEYSKRAEYGPALDDMEKVLAFSPGHAPAREQIALIREKQKELEGVRKKQTAERLYDRALMSGHENKWRDALRSLNDALKLDPRHEKAAAQLKVAEQKVRELDVKEAEALSVRALSERRAGRLEKAIGLWEKALELDPGSAKVRAELELAKAGQTDLNKEKARTYSDEALKEYGRGNLKEAAALWEKALKLDPASSGARSNLDRVMKELK